MPEPFLDNRKNRNRRYPEGIGNYGSKDNGYQKDGYLPGAPLIKIAKNYPQGA